MHVYINDRPICIPQGKVPGVAEVIAGRACPTGTSLLQLGLAVANRSQASIFSLKIFFWGFLETPSFFTGPLRH